MFALDIVRPTALLGPGLHDPAAFLHGLDLVGTFGEGVGHRFLEVNVFARRERIDEHLLVPVVRSRNNHCIHIFLFKELAVVSELRRFGAGLGGRPVAMGLGDICHGCHIHARHGLRASIAEYRTERDPSVLGIKWSINCKPGRLSQSCRSAPDHSLPRHWRRNGHRMWTKRHAPLRQLAKPIEKAAACCFIVHRKAPEFSCQHREERRPINLPAQTVGQEAPSTAFCWLSVRTASNFLAVILAELLDFSVQAPPACRRLRTP